MLLYTAPFLYGQTMHWAVDALAFESTKWKTLYSTPILAVTSWCWVNIRVNNNSVNSTWDTSLQRWDS